MDGRQFDELAKALATGISRRSILNSLAGGLAIALAGGVRAPRDASAQSGEPCQTDRNCGNLKCCDGVCRDLLNDRNHCGSCEFGCQGDATCCRGACRDTKTDRNHCGGCLQACPPREICVGSRCCPEGSTLVGGECCPPGSVVFGDKCCPAGSRLIRGECCPPGDLCGLVCCAAGEVCVSPPGEVPRCCGRRQRCGERCCPADQECVDPATCCPIPQICNTATARVVCCADGTACIPGQDCCLRERVCGPPGKQDCCDADEDCFDDSCVLKSLDTTDRPCAADDDCAADETCAQNVCLASDGEAAAGPLDLSAVWLPPGAIFGNGTMVYQASGLSAVGRPPQQVEAVASGFVVGHFYHFTISSGDGSTIRVNVGKTLHVDAAAASAAVEAGFATLFSVPSGFQDATVPIGEGPMFVALYELASTESSTGLLRRRHSGFRVGALVGEVILEHPERMPSADEAAPFIDSRLAFFNGITAGQQPDPPMLGSLMVRVEEVETATVFPGRQNGQDVILASYTAADLETRRIAHGDAEQVWLNNYLIPGTSYRLFNRIWSFATPEAAASFAAQMPAPLLPTYQDEGIELTAVDMAEIVAGLTAYFFTWPQVGTGHQVLFPLDRYVFSLSIADTTQQVPGDGAAQDESKQKTKDATEEMLRRWSEQIERALLGGKLLFELLPELEAPKAAGGGGQCAPEQKKPKPLFVNEEGTLLTVPNKGVCQGDVVDEDEVIEPLKCDTESYIYSSYREIVQNCAGFGGAADRDNAVCKSAAEGGQKGAATIPCPTNDCPQRELTEIFRGWECGPDPDDLARTGQLRTICAVQLKLVCRVSL